MFKETVIFLVLFVSVYATDNLFFFKFTENLTIPGNKNSLQMFPSKISAKLTSWQPATFEEFQVRALTSDDDISSVEVVQYFCFAGLMGNVSFLGKTRA